jgi:histone-lysine N-methyltransferase SETMAR
LGFNHKSITNIHRRLTNVYGDMAVDKSTVSRWAKRLAPSEQGQGYVSDLPRSGHERVILIDVLPRGQKINSEVYVETLKKRFRRVRPHKDVTKVLFHHDNAKPHTSLHTREAITKFQWTVPPHPPYSPDLAPSNYHLFSPLKDTIRGKKFQDEEEVISEIKRWLRRRPAEWYREGIHALTSRWRIFRRRLC